MNDQTKAILASMLTENTGRAMCDSGDYYGRAWQRNQGKTVADFEKEPEAKLEVSLYRHSEPPKAELMVTLSTYHFLKERVEFEEWLQTAFDAYVAGTEAEDDAQNAIRPYSAPDRSWFTLAGDFITDFLPTQFVVWDQGYRLATPEEILDCMGPGRDEDEQWQIEENRRQLSFQRIKVRGPWGDGDKPSTTNTYNHEDALSQTLQYTLFTLGDVDQVFMALFIHGGCDARAGYTAPKFFNVGGKGEWTNILDNARYAIEAYDEENNTRAHWDHDGGGSPAGEWDRPGESAQQTVNGMKLAAYGRLEPLESYPVVEVERLPDEPEAGVLYLNEEANIAWCPFTHQPLGAYAWPAG